MANKLSREQILKATQDYYLINGKMPSIRKLATELDSDPMAIYYYFSSKQALLEALCCELVGAIEAPTTGRWQARVQALCEQYLALLQRYPGLLHILLTLESDGPAQRFCQCLQTLLSAQYSSADIAILQDLIADYLHGVALAQEAQPEQWPAIQQSFTRVLPWLLKQPQR
ncbi:TetR family transcriptional regulator [Bacterioplanes sanyensis]|uniref:TetR family transcriptional regulator n=1 Tax=Bacterioplanes sanyensis TaxID=1249553 RepID=A0A222FHD8_9GAMM|nr:TetR/AcrR family transcriptional regulator [Bacterioplanes sanyensis]ASP37653.1 TetR family transcriptional regulator [Bacterioplanes sanyensis]